jgi:hypothetical protein
MLSYLKDGARPTSEEDRTTESGAPGGGQEFLTTAHHGKAARQGTLILAILFAVGAVVVWWMIKKVAPGPAAAAADDGAKIEEVLSQLSTFRKEVSGQMDTMVSRFYQASELGQIGANELKKNPFRLEVTAGETISPEDLTQARRLMLREEVERQSGKLQLWSITERPQNPCCMINDTVLYVGDTIEGFTIRAIESQRVLLEQDGVQVELKMQE